MKRQGPVMMSGSDEHGFSLENVPKTDPMAGQFVKILVVEQSKDIYGSIEAMLLQIDRCVFEVEWVDDATTALASIAKEDHDVYLVDLVLGDSGIDVIREARRLGCRRPLLAMAGCDVGDMGLRAMRAGATDFMSQSEMRPESLERMIRYAMERKRAEQRILWLARHDQLTGLENRSRFREHLSRAVARATSCDLRTFLFALNIDRMREINERVGHDGGDVVLCEIAHRLTAVTRDSCVAGRVGSDEFSLLVEHIDTVDKVGELARALLHALTAPIRVEASKLQVRVNIGIAVFPDDATTIDSLLRAAQEAMERAQALPESGYQFRSQQTTAHVLARHSLSSQLNGALLRREFILHYQPVVTCRGRHPRAVEALIRWQTSDMRLVSPTEFMSVLERSEAFMAVSQWAMSKALQDFRRLLNSAPQGVQLVLNLTLTELLDEGLAPRLASMLKRFEVAPSMVQIDISEQILASAPDSLYDATLRLKTLGVSLAVDRFGAAGASLSALARYPIDAIKLETRLVQDIAFDRQAVGVATALIATGHGLGMEVFAAGVQTREQLAVLRDHDCDAVQGFLFGGPTSADATSAWLKRVEILRSKYRL